MGKLKPLQRYKEFVRAHPGLVSNLDWLVYLTVFNPSRTGSNVESESQEWKYEGLHALVGLLSVWHQHIIEEEQLPVARPTAALWLDLLEQVGCCFWGALPGGASSCALKGAYACHALQQQPQAHTPKTEG